MTMRNAVGAMIAVLALLAPPLAAQQASREIAVTMPANDQTVHSNTGEVDVAVRMAPPLAAGETIVITLDEREMARGPQRQVQLTGVERGTHVLQARIIDRDGKTVGQSDPVTFHMWQASRLFPARKKQ